MTQADRTRLVGRLAFFFASMERVNIFKRGFEMQGAMVDIVKRINRSFSGGNNLQTYSDMAQ